MASDEFIKEFFDFFGFAWPLLLSIIIWLVVSFSPNPPQRRLDDSDVETIIDESTETVIPIKSASLPSTFKSIDDSFYSRNHALLPDSRFHFRRKKYEGRRRWSSTISLTSASSDLYFGRSPSCLVEKPHIFSSLCDSGHVSLRESAESLPNYSSLDREFIEIQQFVDELNRNLENISPGQKQGTSNFFLLITQKI